MIKSFSKKLSLLGFVICLVVILFFEVPFALAEYTETLGYSPIYNRLGGAGLFYGGSSLTIDESVCQQGSDFIVQINPLSCEPDIVTSNLLAEENVNVFCKMSAIKINPLIDVKNINYIRIRGDYPREVVNVGYMPAQSALGYSHSNNLEGSLLLDNLGYAVITLRKQPIESALTNCEKTALGTEICWVNGTLTAKLEYDAKNTFGIGNALFYLPLLSEDDWKENYVRYSFWDGRGYLRAESIDVNSARISVYSDNTILKGILSGGRKYALQKYKENINLALNEKSDKIYLPGMSPCLASLELKLEDIVNPDSFAKIKINGDYIELRKGETFLNEMCKVISLDSKGLSQEVQIMCREDNSAADTFYLRIFPKVTLNVNGKSGTYGVGDYLYTSEDGKRSIYLGYLGVVGDNVIVDTSSIKDKMYVYLVALPIKKNSLSYDEITSVARVAEAFETSSGKTTFLSNVYESSKKIAMTHIYIGKMVIEGEKMKFIPHKDSSFGGVSISYDFEGGKVLFEGLSRTDYIDIFGKESSHVFIDYYNSAMSSFDTVINSYPMEVPDSSSLQTYGELALIEEINLAYKVGQKETMLRLCKQFAEDYPRSISSLEICLNPIKISNSENAVKDVLINGNIKEISFEGVSDPSVLEYSAKVIVTSSNGKSQVFDLRKNKPISLDNLREADDLKKLKVSEYIMLEDLSLDGARIKISVDHHGINDEVLVDSKVLTKGTSSPKYGNYTFLVSEITLKKVAKVSVIANTDFAKSESEFNFKIGIEKRAIQLSPEKAAEKLEKVNKRIESWEKVSKASNTIITAGNAACFATGGWLVLKNLINNVGGKATARKEVMSGTGGWNDICREEMEKDPTKYKSLNSCFLAHSDKIEEDVNKLSKVIAVQDKIIDRLVDEDSVKITRNLSNDVLNKIDSMSSSKLSGIEGLDDLKSAISSDYLAAKGTYTFEEIREIQMYLMYLNENPADPNDKFRDAAIQRLNLVITNVNKNSGDEISMISQARDVGIDPNKVILSKEQKETGKHETYRGQTVNSLSLELEDAEILGINSKTPIATMLHNSKMHILILKKDPLSDYYAVMKDPLNFAIIYDGEGKKVTDSVVLKQLGDYLFKEIDYSSFINPYKSSYGSKDILLKYSGNPSYKDKPTIVPFDKEEGWYAGIDTPETSYDNSGVIREFWLCNVGENGVEEFQIKGYGDDKCLLVNTGRANEANPFPSEVNIDSKIREAKEAILSAQKGYKDGVTGVKINSKMGTVKVGEPLANSLAGECTDFMSVEDCILLFNVCDPFVCPNTRCDYGGKYPVQDVVQTGIVGGFFMCYDNAKWKGGDVYVPFCLSAINAGLQNLVSVQKNYAECLQRSLETGEMVGICDEVYSIYLCEFFWKQAIPLIKMNFPKILGKIMNMNIKGGGEYKSFVQSLKNAQDSATYLMQHYAKSSYDAFRVRSTEGIGASACGMFVSVTYPNSGNLLSRLFAPHSPFQFTGKFDETVITTSTNPPTSHYGVYFNIYAGTDTEAYYRVYLKGSGSSYYQDTAADRVVDSGYILLGNSVDKKVDFTAPSGYNILCISVNGHERCGFKEVSTSFAINYLSEKYVQDQVSKSGITTKDECTNGASSLYSLLDLNVQSAAQNYLTPDIYSQGITRVCSTENPGLATEFNPGDENSRWKKVGYCENKNIGCWIDIKSIKDAIQFLDIENKTLEEISKNSQKYLSGTYYSLEEFEDKKNEIKSEIDAFKKLELIKTLLNSGKVYFNSHKAFLYFERGIVYSQLAGKAYEDYVEKLKEDVGEQIGDAGEHIVEPDFETIYVSPIFTLGYKRGLLNLGRGEACYIFFDSKWHWTASCNAAKREGKESTLWKPITGESQIESISVDGIDIINSFLSKSYLEGVKLFVELAPKQDVTSISTDSTTLIQAWYETSPTTLSKTFAYSGDREGWYWSTVIPGVPKEFTNSMSVNELTVSGGSDSGKVVPSSSLDYSVILSLRGVDKYSGAAILFDINNENARVHFGSSVPAAPTPLVLENSLQRRDVARLTTLMNSISTSVFASSFKCYCENDCGNYANWIVESTAANNLPDELLLLAIMIQESSCRSVASSDGNDIGLMQINLNNCGSYSLLSGREACKSVLLDNKRLNINVGAQILKDKYLSYSGGRSFSCPPLLTSYSGWEAALRGYNGWGCTGNNNYVEDVKQKYFELVELYGGDNLPDSTIPTDSTAPTTLTPTRQRVLMSVQQLEGTIVPDRYNEHCGDASNYIYQHASAGLSNCIYSAKKGIEYTLSLPSGATATVGIGSQRDSSGNIIWVTADRCTYTSDTLSYPNLLRSLTPGDRIDIVYSQTKPHSLVFLNWVEGQEYIVANLSDWNGNTLAISQRDRVGRTCTDLDTYSDTSRCKVYQYVQYDLRIDRHPVYRVWNPVQI